MSSSAADDSAVNGGAEFMLFGFRVVVDPMRKSVSMNNLSQYEQKPCDDNNKSANKEDAAGEYASADDALPKTTHAGRERKRGVPWTEEEHKLFLLGLQKVGKGDWRGISRNFVKTRTPTQVASHAQKYFLRRNNHNRRRRRSSLFDITTETVVAAPMEEEQVPRQENSSYSHLLPPPPPLETYSFGRFALGSAYPVLMSVPTESPMESLALGHGNDSSSHGSTKLVSDLDLSLNSTEYSQPLALKLSLSSDDNQSPRHPAFQAMSSYSNGDSMISVA